MYKSLCDLWKTDFHFFPPKCFMSATLHRMLCCLYKINLFFLTFAISPMSVSFFSLYPLQKKKKSNCRNSTPPTKVPLKNAARKRHGQNSQQKYQIIKLDIYNHYPQYFKATGKSRCWGRGVEIYLCSAILMCLTAANLKTTEHQHCFICGKTML